jgi:TPR repeat protein
MPKRLWAAMFAGGVFAFGAAQAAPLPPEPPSKVYVPGNQKRFQEGVAAFDAHDYAKAYAIFTELARHHDIAALRNVAYMQRKGLGTKRNPKAALDNYKLAAVAGMPTAAADLGQMLLYGEAGPADPKAALRWLKMAAAASHPVAQFLLGQMYEFGEAVPQDYQKAKRLYAASAARGYTPAIYRLSYLNGWPMPSFDNTAAPAHAAPKK